MFPKQSPLEKHLADEKNNFKSGELGPIFIVDDNEDDQFFLGHEIKALFGEAPVRIFKNGMRLLDYFYEISRLGKPRSGVKEIPRLILMDLYMPGMSGLLALKTLRHDLGIADIPVIIVSGTKDAHEIEKVYQYGATAFLPKPFSRKEFIGAVHRYASLAHIV